MTDTEQIARAYALLNHERNEKRLDGQSYDLLMDAVENVSIDHEQVWKTCCRTGRKRPACHRSNPHRERRR